MRANIAIYSNSKLRYYRKYTQVKQKPEVITVGLLQWRCIEATSLQSSIGKAVSEKKLWLVSARMRQMTVLCSGNALVSVNVVE